MSESAARRLDARDAGRAPGTHGVRLLEVDPDLGAALTPEMRAEAATQVVLPSARLTPGPWDTEQLRASRGVHGRISGFLVVEGAITAELSISAHVCTRVLVSGELVLLDGDAENSIGVRSGWTVLESTTLALLDDRLLIIARRWPALMSAILMRAAQQIRHALLQQAIGQLPRVEDRLLALMWSIADRRGVMRPDGVWVRLPVTHAVLAQMIGAQRPTVSLGLRSLAERGHLRADDGGWWLSRESLQAFAPPVPRGDARG